MVTILLSSFINKNGKQYISKFINHKHSKLNSKHSNRFEYIDQEIKRKNLIPDPGKYNNNSQNIINLSFFLFHIPKK